ncbi:MAG: flagellar brake protein [Gammaproteobacteria bacterium]|nr:flagellar brake protein [Gammaproteobacteria bacterium]MBU1777389.1 flagellar brake protein [Gammaproteobacteria bacterium]MBU1970123.1 flagellar brake protein [Gammaproteobacteria bacterium]
MNLQPVSIEDVPIGVPLPWRLYDHNRFIVFARGEMVTSRDQLESLLPVGLLRDMDAQQQTHESGDWTEFRKTQPITPFPPPGIQPQVGEMVQLRLINRSVQTYYSARLIGYIRERSVLVMTPMLDGVPLILDDGEQLEVRMVTGNNIYVFQAAIQRLCTSPVHYMHLEYPAEVRTQKLRRSPWARVSLDATVTDPQGTREIVRIVNLSPDGAQLHAPPTLGEPGGTFRLAFLAIMDDLGTTLNLEASILHVRIPRNTLGNESNLLEYGIAFRNVSASDALWLKGLVYHYIAEGHMV